MMYVVHTVGSYPHTMLPKHHARNWAFDFKLSKVPEAFYRRLLSRVDGNASPHKTTQDTKMLDVQWKQQGT